MLVLPTGNWPVAFHYGKFDQEIIVCLSRIKLKMAYKTGKGVPLKYAKPGAKELMDVVFAFIRRMFGQLMDAPVDKALILNLLFATLSTQQPFFQNFHLIENHLKKLLVLCPVLKAEPRVTKLVPWPWKKWAIEILKYNYLRFSVFSLLHINLHLHQRQHFKGAGLPVFDKAQRQRREFLSGTALWLGLPRACRRHPSELLPAYRPDSLIRDRPGLLSGRGHV